MTSDPWDKAVRREAAPQAEQRDPEAFVAFLKDNLEAIAVAVVLALVIKHFCVEAFKIPTSSMKPTLYGDGDDPLHPENKGDRILVDKFAYLLRDPQRWDIPVFRYPLNRARNFIKRIVGLPGERLRISSDGDIWVRPSGDDGSPQDLRIAQKPRRVREQFYRPVYPPPGDEERDDEEHDPRDNMERYWRVDEGPPGAWRIEAHDLMVFTGGARGVLRSGSQIGIYSQPDTWGISGSPGATVRDVRLRMRIRLEPGGAERTRFSLAWRPDDDIQAVLALSSDPAESRAFYRRGTTVVREAPLDVALEPGGRREIELEYVDGMLHVHVDGSERVALPDGRRFADTHADTGSQRLTFAAEGGGLRLEDLRIDRDLCYVNEWAANASAQRNGVDIPEDCYFMLGDNVGNSSDSRRWRLKTVHLKGGRTIRFDETERRFVRGPDGSRSLKQVIDEDGILRTWAESDEDETREGGKVPAPFVRRELIIGRAFLTFWPCLPDFPGRLGFIR